MGFDWICAVLKFVVFLQLFEQRALNVFVCCWNKRTSTLTVRITWILPRCMRRWLQANVTSLHCYWSTAPGLIYSRTWTLLQYLLLHSMDRLHASSSCLTVSQRQVPL